eukprot:1459337-Prymnesium_polylepis.1
MALLHAASWGARIRSALPPRMCAKWAQVASQCHRHTNRDLSLGMVWGGDGLKGVASARRERRRGPTRDRRRPRRCDDRAPTWGGVRSRQRAGKGVDNERLYALLSSRYLALRLSPGLGIAPPHGPS